MQGYVLVCKGEYITVAAVDPFVTGKCELVDTFSNAGLGPCVPEAFPYSGLRTCGDTGREVIYPFGIVFTRSDHEPEGRSTALQGDVMGTASSRHD